VWRHIADAIRAQSPDRVIVTEDLTGNMLRAALTCAPDRVVYLAHSQVAVPFGPESFQRNVERTELLRRCTRIITVSRYLRDYLLRFGDGLASTVLRFPVYGEGSFAPATRAGDRNPHPYLGRDRGHDRGHVLMINPSAIKGLAIFTGLARRFPDIPFAAVPTWATTDAERTELSAIPNVRLLPLQEDLDQLYAGARVLVVPSLWGESFGQVIVEAMLRGIPVIASHVGGIPEAKLGVDYLVPVRGIEGYRATSGANGFPDPIIPDQDLEPWIAALRDLLASAARYEQVSAASQQAAARFVDGLAWEPFLAFLADSVPPPSG
jgi:glycosyltransferase involved in cell wall biosynthesis